MTDEKKAIAQGRKEKDFKEEDKMNRTKGIFDGLVIYINGSTYPSISDYKLKLALAENGARMSLHLGRKQVTHVILGKPSGAAGIGAGGGLSGTKIEKEIRRVGGHGVKYVGVEW
jgi:twin BRCT domain